MINNDRIVPIMKMDLLTMLGTVLNIASVEYDVLAATSIDGNFSVTGTGAAGTFLANQPVFTLDFADGVTGGTVYFVAAFDYSGFTVNGAAATMGEDSVTVNPDGVTLYKAVLDSGEVTISAVSPVLVNG